MNKLTITESTILGGTLDISAEPRSAFGGWVDIKIDFQNDDKDESPDFIRITPTKEQVKQIIRVLQNSIEEYPTEVLQEAADVFISTATA